MRYCVKCGSQLDPAAAFCTRCGRSVSANGPDEPGPITRSAPTQDGVVTHNKGGGLLRIAVAALLAIVVIGSAAVGASIYGYHRVKAVVANLVRNGASEEQTALGRAAESGSPGERGSAAQPDESVAKASDADRTSSPQSQFPDWKSGDQSLPSASDPAPLRKGMLVVTAVADATGDYESFKTITDIDGRGVKLSYKSERPSNPGKVNSASRPETTTTRLVLKEDLQSAHDYAENFGDNDPASFPGTTAITASTDVLAELRQRGETHFTFRPDGIKGAASSILTTLSGIAGVDPTSIGDGSIAKMQKEACTLKRAGNADVAFPVLLNEHLAKLPALRAACDTDDGRADFYILDEPAYPLMLQWRLGEGSTLQVIKITYPLTLDTKSQLEDDLGKQKKVEIYGIYFDFASDHLKPESTPVLNEIASVMKKHPDWKLSVSGHTDNIGGDSYNLDLSKRRSAAVKAALVSQYRISPDRLTDSGYGASRPIDRNDTLEGRARNRRVELTRE